MAKYVCKGCLHDFKVDDLQEEIPEYCPDCQEVIESNLYKKLLNDYNKLEQGLKNIEQHLDDTVMMYMR